MSAKWDGSTHRTLSGSLSESFFTSFTVNSQVAHEYQECSYRCRRRLDRRVPVSQSQGVAPLMANLPLAFAEAGIGAILLVAGISGTNIGDVIRGKVTMHGLTESTAAATTGTGASGSPPNYTPGGGTAGDQKTFGKYFAQYTGLSQQTVDAWLLHEQPAGSPATPGSNNWLNIGYTDSGPIASYWNIAGMNAKDAAKASADWLKQNQPSIAAAAGQGPINEAEAIIQSGWASSHYGYEAPSQWLAV